MSQTLEIRDPIHGFIFREPHERDLIDTSIFQRLRRLKQLALATLVYPGATHTRFDHSLGAFSVGSKIVRHLPASDTERRLVRLAALLHDIGHGPFSHVSEDIYEETTEKEAVGLKPRQQVHEAITSRLILTDKEIGHLLSERERRQIVGLLDGEYGDSVLKDIVSGPIDADKQDYLLRDSYFCGVKYGIYDLERLTETLRVHEDSADRFLALSVDGVHALEQFVLAKYYMSTQVYRHKIRLITDEMIVRGVVLGIKEDNIGWLRDLYAYDHSDDFLENYKKWSDEGVILEILNPRTPDGYAKHFFRRLAKRELYKCVFDGKPADFSPTARHTIFESGARNLYRQIEQQVGEAYGWNPNHVLMKRVTHKSVRTQTTGSEGYINVLRPGLNPRPFHEESTLFNSINEAIKEEYVQIYAAVSYKDEKDKKRRLNEFARDITEIIERAAQDASPQKPLPLRGISEGEIV